MDDRVGDVLAQRAALESGATAGVALSIFLHASIGAAVVYAAMHQAAPQMVNVLTINLKPMTAAAAKTAAPPVPKTLPEPQAVVDPPKPEAKPEPKTVPLSPFGRSTKKGSDVPAPPPARAATAATTTAAPIDIPLGGTGATIEGGDFPYTIYIENMKRLIGTHWFRPQVLAGTATTVYFAVDRDGSIRDAKVETPSGNSTFDRAALRSILESTPLPPLPFAYSGTFIGVHLTFK